MPASAAAEARTRPSLAIRDLVIAYPGVGPVLAVPALDVPAGSLVGIEGPSGAGKSSLLHALAGIERPAEGGVQWGEVALWRLSRPARDRWRREELGLVFQDMHLLDGLSALENVLLPLLFDHARAPAPLRDRAAGLLATLGIAAPDRRTAVMSRGERQRVALARALLRDPAVLLADEPTASLDQVSAAQVGELLVQAAAASGASLFVATHDRALLGRLPHRLRLQGGALERVT
ncbi:MAG: ATP-binding cassette domain-containing protein [Acetobacteraceae bacterium]